MKIIWHNAEEVLLSRIKDLRQKNSGCFSILWHFSKLQSPPAKTVIQSIAKIVEKHIDAVHVTLFVLNNKDAVIFAPFSPTTPLAPIAKDICALFPGEPLAQSEVVERGNDLCTIYKSRDSLSELEKMVARLNTDRAAAPQQKNGDPIYEPDPSQFAKGLAQRRERLKTCVLVVEDQRFSRELVMQILGRHFDVLIAGDGVEGLQLYEAYAPDMVFLDIDLPGMNGFAALDIISQMDKEAFVVMLTASHAEEDVLNAMTRKAKGYIVKPFSRKKIEQYLDAYYRQFPDRAMML